MSELINYQFKDRVIRLLFGTSKENALSLYNAVNRSEYDNPDDLEFNTIADAIYFPKRWFKTTAFQAVITFSSFFPILLNCSGIEIMQKRDFVNSSCTIEY